VTTPLQILETNYDTFRRQRPRTNPGEPLDQLDLFDEYLRFLEKNSVDIGVPSDADLDTFLGRIGISDPHTQIRAVEMMVEWNLSDAEGQPQIV